MKKYINKQTTSKETHRDTLRQQFTAFSSAGCLAKASSTMWGECYASRVESMQVMWVEYLHRLVSIQVFKLSTHINTNSLNYLNTLS